MTKTWTEPTWQEFFFKTTWVGRNYQQCQRFVHPRNPSHHNCNGQYGVSRWKHVERLEQHQMASIMRRQNPNLGDAVFAGRFLKARYGIRDAVQKVMEGFGFVVCMFQPSVCYHPSKDLFGRCGARGRSCAQKRWKVRSGTSTIRSTSSGWRDF